jgi:hypothetical protein
VPGDKVLRGWDAEAVQAAMLNDLVSELGQTSGDQPSAVLNADASRIGILIVDQVRQDLAPIGALLGGFAPSAAEALAEIIKYQVDVDVVGRAIEGEERNTETPQLS